MPRTAATGPTLSDIATAAGVSVASVSRYMKGNSSLGEEIRDKIENALVDLENDSSWSRPRRFRQDRVLGLILPDLQNPFYPAVVKGIESVTKSRGYDIIFCDSEDDSLLERKQLHRLWEIGTSGTLFVPTGRDDDKIRTAVRKHDPIVFLDRVLDMNDVSVVETDNDEGARQATRYLLELGHRQIAYLTWPMEVSSRRNRFAGFQAEMARQRVPFDSRGVITVDPPDHGVRGDRQYDNAYDAVSTFLRENTDITAVFAASDVLGLVAKHAAEGMGLSVPGDLSMIAYDDVPLAQFAGLTTISSPAHELGSNAATLLIDLIEGRVAPPKRIILRPSIVIRSTCRRLG